MPISTYFTQEKISKKVYELASRIDKDFSGEEVIVIGVLNGSFIFVSDLVRAMKTPVYIDFMAVSSYVGSKSTGELSMLKDIKIDVKGKNVILVEDIVDTGLTIEKLKELFIQRGVKQLKIASLLHKSSKTTHEVSIDYLGFEIEDKFVVGYGLDYNGKYRELPYIGEYSEG